MAAVGASMRRPVPGWRRAALPLALALLASTVPARLTAQATQTLQTPQTARIACVDDDPPAAPAAAVPWAESVRAMQSLVAAALERSRSLGAARALAEAAARDVDETRAGADPRATLTAQVGPDVTHGNAGTASRVLQASASAAVSGLLWDGGRQQHLVDWRTQLAEATRLATLTQQEQIALGAVSLALEHERWRAQERVWGQYVGRMACLVDALAEVVRADRGRASELLQARKALQQAELSLATTASQRRQASIRLERLIGAAEPVDAIRLGGALLPLPALDRALADSARSAEIAQLERQSQAAARLADAVQAQTRPSLSWLVNGSHSLSRGGNVAAAGTRSIGAGVQLSVPLFDPAARHAADAARARALAAREQLEDAIESRQARVREVHEQAQSSLDRAQRVARVIADSHQLRQATQLQWQQLGRRSLFDVMGAEADHYNLRIAEVNAWFDAQTLAASLQSLGGGLLGGGPVGGAMR